MPDGDTIGRFRNILIKNGIQEKFFALIVKKLMEEKLILKKGTIVDSTFIEAPSSTKNREKKRVPTENPGRRETPGTSDTRLTSVWIRTAASSTRWK